MLLLFSHSGKTVPNGTDKNQLGTPENEGKFQKCLQFTVKANLESVDVRHMISDGFFYCRSPSAGYFV